MISLTEAVESAKISAGPERILRSQHYDDLLKQLPEEEHYAFTMALVELSIGPRTGALDSKRLAAFLRDEVDTLDPKYTEDRIVVASFQKDAQWWENMKTKFKDWWDEGPEDEYEEETGEPFEYPAETPEALPADEVQPADPLQYVEEDEVQPPPVFDAPADVIREEAPVEPVDPGFPEMVPVDSSNLEAVGYDDDAEMLYIAFQAKRNTPSTLYQYFNVPRQVYDDLINLEATGGSVGRYFHQNVREIYQYSKLNT